MTFLKKPTKKKVPKANSFELKIDHETVITVRTQEALKYWLDEYPSAKILSSS